MRVPRLLRRRGGVALALAGALVMASGLGACGAASKSGASGVHRDASTTAGAASGAAASGAAASGAAASGAAASGAAGAGGSADATAPLDGPTLQHPAQAPPLVLDDYLGHRVDLASYRSKAVFLTFIYTHCPDVCPLIVANLHNALGLLGANRSKMQIVAVTTDPTGDTRQAIASFLAHREMTGRMEYLVGSRSALVPIWHSWNISVTDPTAQDEVNHSALVYGISGSGKVTTVYPANFTPKDIAHDTPLLAAR